MILNWLRRGFTALSIIATASFPTLAAARNTSVQVAKPALWQVSDGDTRIYLFGTIHLLPSNFAWKSAKLDAAVDQSQQLIVETMIDDKYPMALFGELQRLGMSPNLPPLTARVPAAKRATLEAAVKASGVPMAAYNRLETWAAAFLLIGNQFKGMGLQGSEGVEAVLRKSFVAAGKPIGELETNREQLGFFDTLPEAAQRSLLEGALDQPKAMAGQFNAMLSAWSRGDVAAIAKTFNAEMEGSPALMEALIARRNANWTQWIARRMQQPGTVLLAVGAGHLAGDRSVQALLKRQGYRVTRVQ
jgi:uncharacterized protein